MTSNWLFRDDKCEIATNKVEKAQCKLPHQDRIYKWLADDKTDMKNSMWLHPNLMGDDLASRVPPVVIITGEYDFLRYASLEAAELYKRNGKLLEVGDFGGGWHASYGMLTLKSAQQWIHKDFPALIDRYLS